MIKKPISKFFLFNFICLWLAVISAKGDVFYDNNNGTITDKSTGLTWQKSENRLLTWEEALAFCENETDLGGKSDWRLPNINELISLVDYTKFYPAIDQVHFPNVIGNYYWSSTTMAELGFGYAWYVFFYDGSVDGKRKSENARFFCVRGGF